MQNSFICGDKIYSYQSYSQSIRKDENEVQGSRKIKYRLTIKFYNDVFGLVYIVVDYIVYINNDKCYVVVDLLGDKSQDEVYFTILSESRNIIVDNFVLKFDDVLLSRIIYTIRDEMYNYCCNEIYIMDNLIVGELEKPAAFSSDRIYYKF